MTQFKVGDEVQLVKDTQLFKRRKKGIIREITDKLIRLEYKGHAGSWVPYDYIRPYTPRIRPSKSDITKLKQEIAIGNEAIDRLENDVRILHSEKVRMGEQLAYQKETTEHRFDEMIKKREGMEDTITHLTEQNDALKSDFVACQELVMQYDNERFELTNKLKAANELVDELMKDEIRTASSLYLWKAAAVVALVADMVLGAVLIWG